MATRPRRGGAATPSRRTPRPVYEDFKPTSKWLQDDENHNLFIDLPGFTEKQLKVTTEGRNIISVRGERLIARNKWSRFREDFQVPANGEMKSVRAKLQGGTLIITVPKEKVDKPQEPVIAKTPVPEISKQPTPQEGQDKAPPAVGASQPTDGERVEPQKASDDAKMQWGQAELPRHGRSSVPSGYAGKVPPPDLESSESKEKHVTEMTVDKEEASKRSKELPEDETAKKIKPKTGDGAAATSEAKETDKESRGKQDIDSNGVLTMGKNKKAVKGITELDEERQSLVNMGVAVLVIMALSAYVTYQFASGKDKS